MIVISDTSAITNLAAIVYLQSLPQLYGQVAISEAAYHENKAAIKMSYIAVSGFG